MAIGRLQTNLNFRQVRSSTQMIWKRIRGKKCKGHWIKIQNRDEHKEIEVDTNVHIESHTMNQRKKNL